ncbi:MAG: PilC/PilY family type IV pilus protein [Pseudomonadota bacterium]
MKTANSHPLLLIGSFVCGLLAGANAHAAASAGLADVPLYVMPGVDPNIYLSMDDSGSMDWSYLPDDIYVDYATNRAKSSSYNKIYYDPSVTYAPPVDENGASLGNADFTAAWNNGFNKDGAGECVVDLSLNFRPTWYYGDHCDGIDEDVEFAGAAEPAYSYIYDGSGEIDVDASYTKVVVGADEQTNFANWYAYYRKRSYAAKSAATLAFARLSSSLRVARQTINGGGVNDLNSPVKFEGAARADFFDWISQVPASGSTLLRSALNNVGKTLQDSDDPYRDDPSDSSSEARSCRQNFHIMLTDGYWSITDSGIGDNQDNTGHDLPANDYGVLSYTPMAPYRDANIDYLADTAFYYWFTDLRGTLNNEVPRNIRDITSDLDGDGTVGKSDIFWNPKNDPANWQHMVTYTIGLGVKGTLDFPGDYASLLDGSKTWGADEIDDLWHAAINGRGAYFSAANASELVDALGAALPAVLAQSATAAPVSLNSGSISSETRLFQVKFHTENWTGQVFSFPISDGSQNSTCTISDPIGTVCDAEWEAGCLLDGGLCEATGTSGIGLAWDSGRQIVTLNPSSGNGVPFRWTATPSDTTISADQVTLLNDADSLGQERLEYLRGNQALEGGGGFRGRDSLLGDIINSNPLYVGKPSRFYPDALETSSYASFRTAQSSRPGMVFVGANEGMLHAFDSATGEEKLAYVPNAVFPNLVKLTDPAYAHTNFVDGKLNEGDVFFASDIAWHSVVVGGLGLGGQGLFALDVTNPGSFSEANASDIVLWEFTDANDPELGFTYGKPIIGKLNDGHWYAIFGNGFDNMQADGYASTSGQAAVYIVDIEDGSLFKKISTNEAVAPDINKVDVVVDPTGAGRANALVAISPVDVDGDFMIDYLYGGDLFGNVWRFDLLGGNKLQWQLAFGGAPLFQAKDSLGNAQPITTLTAVGRHPSNVGLIAYFGTGKYLGPDDILDTNTQTFYGIWDRWFDDDGDTTHDEKHFAAFDRTALLQQEILGTNLNQFTLVDARVTTNHSIDWETQSGWYLDLTEPGERVHQDPILRNDRIIFVTVTPSDDPCVTGGTSWLMELDARDGSRLSKSPFDYDGANGVNEEDLVSFDADADGTRENVVGSGIRHDLVGGNSGGIYTSPAVLKLPTEDKERKYMATSKGAIETVEESSGRRLKRSWREIR